VAKIRRLHFAKKLIDETTFTNVQRGKSLCSEKIRISSAFDFVRLTTGKYVSVSGGPSQSIQANFCRGAQEI